MCNKKVSLQDSFVNEAEMQRWLEEKFSQKKDLLDLIVNDEYLEDYKPDSNETKIIYESFCRCLKATEYLSLISANQNISIEGSESLKPDFLSYASEVQGMVLIELKNLAGSTRTAGTELGAYSGELRTFLPFLSNSDLYYVIISPTWPTLLRHFIFNGIYLDGWNVLCLEPKGKEQLEIAEIEKFNISPYSKLSIDQLTGYSLQLSDSNSLQNKISTLEELSFPIENSLREIVIEGTKERGHGFAFFSELSPNENRVRFEITLVTVAPFHNVEETIKDITSDSDQSTVMNSLINVIKKNDPTGHGKSLDKCREKAEKNLEVLFTCCHANFLSWSELKTRIESNSTEKYFVGWGVFGDRFNQLLIKEYSKNNIKCSPFCPKLGFETINSLVSN